MPTRLQPKRKAARKSASKGVRGEVSPTGGHVRHRNGRPEGALTVRTREVATRLVEDGGVTPLEVMVENMRWFRKQAEAKLREADLIDPTIHEVVEDRDEAESKKRLLLAESMTYRLHSQQSATDAAPYVHPRLQAIAVGGNSNIPVVLMPHPDDARL